MYSTKLNRAKCRYIARCIVNQGSPKFVDFLVDTGAKYTCCSYLSINSKLRENDFAGAERKKLGGFVNGYTLTVYGYYVNQFIVNEQSEFTLRQIRMRRMPNFPVEFVCMVT